MFLVVVGTKETKERKGYTVYGINKLLKPYRKYNMEKLYAVHLPNER
jgi:hypothetical protein